MALFTASSLYFGEYFLRFLNVYLLLIFGKIGVRIYVIRLFVRGLYLHPAIATSNIGIPVGLLNFQIWSHDDEYCKKREGISRKKVPLEDRDSYKWLKSYKSLIKHQESIENNVHFVYICD